MPDATLFGPSVERDASLSPCGRYRWTLSRAWNWSRPWLGWVMLNPSTADAAVDDPTIRRCMGFARAWGFGGIAVRNLFALRSPDPAALLADPDPVGDGNDEAILQLAGVCPVIVCAWGACPAASARAAHVVKLLQRQTQPDTARLVCLGVTKGGHPRHPLYIQACAGAVLYPVNGGAA